DHRKVDNKGTTGARCGLDINPALVAFDDVLGDGQAESCALAYWFGGEKGLKNGLQLVGCNARAVVLYLNQRVTILEARGDFDIAFTVHGLGSVNQQVDEHL